MYHYIWSVQEAIKLFFFLRNVTIMCSACVFKRNFVWIQDTGGTTFIFEVGQSIEELLEFVKA